MSPQYVSEKGLWQPADLAAKEDLKQKGVPSLGVKVKEKPDGSTVYPVMAEPQNELPKAAGKDKFAEIPKRGEVKEEIKKEVKKEE